MSRPPLGLIAVSALLVAGVAVGTVLPSGSPPAPTATAVPVVGAVAMCPDLRTDGDRVRTRVAVGAVAVPDAAGGDGRVDAQPLSGGAAPTPLPLDGPGEVAGDVAPGVDGDALVVEARGPLAAGLEAQQLTRATAGSARGFAGLRCAAPATDTWFVGGSTVVGEATLLLLANPDDTPAVVDVTIWTSTGPADQRPGRGLVVEPRRRASIPLEALAPDRDVLAVRVRAQRGRAAAALRHVRFDGSTPRGIEWVPQAPPPAQEVVVPGLPIGPGRRDVRIANPGRDDAVVTVELTTSDGQLVPEEAEQVRVPAGSSVVVELGRRLEGGPAAARVTSDGPPVLAAGFVFDAGEGGVTAMAYAGAVPALRGPALLPDVVVTPTTETTLLLSALEGDAAVDVVPVPVQGVDAPLPEPRRVEVPGGTTVALRLSTLLPPGSSRRLAVEVRPVAGSGAVHAARFLREQAADGPYTTGLGLLGAGPGVSRPPVVRDPLVGAGG